MKRTIITVAVAVVLSVGITAAITSNSTKAAWRELLVDRQAADGVKTIESKTYIIEAYGNDLRAYSWKDPVHGLFCTFVAGTKKGGLSCGNI